MHRDLKSCNAWTNRTKMHAVFEKNIQSVTPKNIKDALKEVLLDENFITVVVGNENPF